MRRKIFRLMMFVPVLLSLAGCNDVTGNGFSNIESGEVEALPATEQSMLHTDISSSESTHTDTSSSESTHTESTSELTHEVTADGDSQSSQSSDENMSESSSSPTDETSTSTMSESSVETDPPSNEPRWEETEVSLDMYVNKNGVYARRMPIQGEATTRQLQLNERIHAAAKTDTDYYKTDKGDYIHQDYLSDHQIQTSASTATSSQNVQPVATAEYFDEGAWLPIKIDRNKFPNRIPTAAVNIDDERRPVYSELFKQIPGYVSGEFAFRSVSKNIESLKYAHLTKENALKIKELSDHYWDDLMRTPWCDVDEDGVKDYSETFLLSEKRGRVYQLIDAQYCAMHSDVGEYAPDGTQYIGKTLDGYCYTAETGLSHLYWIVAPRELKQLPSGTYCKFEGFGIKFSNTPQDGYKDVSRCYVLAGSLCTFISDKDYEEQWFPKGGGGYITTYPSEEYCIV